MEFRLKRRAAALESKISAMESKVSKLTSEVKKYKAVEIFDRFSYSLLRYSLTPLLLYVLVWKISAILSQL